MMVLLLRGINVGGKNKLPMADLRRLIEYVGGRDVHTYIQSGNAIADGSIKAADLEDVIEAEFGFRPPTLILDESRFRSIAADCPYDLAEGKAVHIWFGFGPIDADLEGARALATDSEQIATTDLAVYLYAPDGIARSKLAERLNRFVNVDLTARNANTVTKLLQLMTR